MGGAQDWRTISSKSNIRLIGSLSSIARLASPLIKMSAAAAAISLIGWRTVVSGGQTTRAVGVSSKPATDRSLGMDRPIRAAVDITPKAMPSLAAKIAVGRSAWRSSCSPACTPD